MRALLTLLRKTVFFILLAAVSTLLTAPGYAATAVPTSAAPPPPQDSLPPAPPPPPSIAPQGNKTFPQATIQKSASTASDAMENARQTVISWGGYFQALAILFGILALLWFALWAFRRRSDMRVVQGLGLRIESRFPLGPKKWIVVARCLDKRMVLGVTDHHISLLSEQPLDAPQQTPSPEPRAAETAAPSFEARLAAAKEANIAE
jgi:flagellar protein FliO/FliZ